MYKMIEDERDRGTTLFSLESSRYPPQFWKDKRTGWQGNTGFDKLSSNKFLVIINLPLMKNDK